MLTATKQWFTLPVLISCYCFVCTQANSGSVYNDQNCESKICEDYLMRFLLSVNRLTSIASNLGIGLSSKRVGLSVT